MVLGKLNKIRNSDFSLGARRPKNWTWKSVRDARWQLLPPSDNGQLAGMVLSTTHTQAAGFFLQNVRCKQDTYYRIEALVTCRCEPSVNGDAGGGLILSLQSNSADGDAGDVVSLPAIRNAERFTIRSYYKTPPRTRSLQVRVGLQGAAGSAAIHDVRVIEVIEPEIKSHPLAIPPPPFANAPPLTASTVCIVTDHPRQPLVDVLRIRYGDQAVKTVPAKSFNPKRHAADAIIVPGDEPPANCRTMAALERLAHNRIVIVSTECLARLSRGMVATRTIRQVDDALHARVVHSNFATAAFALFDLLPFAGRVGDSTEMFQRQFRTNSRFRRFCERHALEHLLLSMTDTDATSEKPIALIRTAKRGALIVMDLDAVEARPTTMNEPNVAVYLLLAALGAPQHTLGQYTDVARDPKELLEHLVDFVTRFPELAWSTRRRPENLDAPVMITLGRDLDSVGLPLNPRPMILIRTGLTGRDLEGLYAVQLWFKQLLRQAPFACPYARTLVSRFRFAWLPIGAPPQPWGGWQPQKAPKPFDVQIEFEPGSVAACIDVTTADRNSVNLLTHCDQRLHDRIAATLPPLLDAIVGKRQVYHGVPDGQSLRDQKQAAWQLDPFRLRVLSTASSDPAHVATHAAAAPTFRIELPASGYISAADSIRVMDWGANVIEQLVGLLLGFVAVNRGSTPIEIPWPESLSDLRDRAALRRINEPDAGLPIPAVRNGRIVLPSGSAMVAVQ